jgi:hypothetical protein
MRWLALVLVLGGCGRSSLMGGSGGPSDMGGPCVGAACADLGDGGDPCADKANCMSPRCAGDVHCATPGQEVCNNGIDDNDDGKVDCADPECATFPGCQPGHMCNSGMPDCSDPACADNPRCQDLQCHPTVDFGTFFAHGSRATRNENTSGTSDVTVTECAPPGGGMVVGELKMSDGADLTLEWSQPSGEDHVFGLFRAGVNQTCGANPIDCVDPKGAPTGTHAFAALPAGRYYIIAQPFEKAGAGPVTVTLSTPSVAEICNNGVDDNGNGLVDCDDADCVNDPNCVNQECTPDINTGALIVNGPAHQVDFDTRTAPDATNNVRCEGTPGGRDEVVRFTLKETAGVLLAWSQTGDHVVGMFRTPQPGLPCDADPLDCYDAGGRPSDTVAWGEFAAGDYELIFKAVKPGGEGHIHATLSAYRTRPVELCHNGIDDDGNGLVDCDDPACKGVAGCSGPYCAPDVNLGTMVVGESLATELDTRSGSAGLSASCAQGGGKARVVQLSVPVGGSNGGFSLSFNCTQTGDHVLALYAAGGPRDACDVNERLCADPNTLPFGCGYVVPNLQPGTYNVVVEAFAPGDEGIVDLQLGVGDDRQLEICNNGIDDDGNGLVDCNDPKCATSPSCSNAQCKPDQTIDPVPLDGTVVAKLVQTAGAATQASPSCVATAGGGTSVIALRLTAKADLKVDWNQLGNHDFALYVENQPMLPCAAGGQAQCTGSTGTATGTLSWKGVSAGRYYLVIAADTPTAAGSVALQLSGSPSP